MKIIFFGLGSIGKRHAKIILDNYDHELTAFRSGVVREANELGIREVSSWQEVLALRPDIAFITNPTHMHLLVALKCAALGMHLFIEKPLSQNMTDVDKLVKLCTQKKITCYTAYCLRFHPVIKELKKMIIGKRLCHIRISCSSYLPIWRPERGPQAIYSAKLDEGGGVILDLSHEFDYIQYLFGEIIKMTANYGRVSDVTVDSEDYADVLLTTANNLPVNLHLDYFSRLNERRIVVDFIGGSIIGDLVNNQLRLIIGNNSEVMNYSIDGDSYLKEQINYFFDNIGNNNIMNNLAEAGGLLSKILELKHG